MSLKIKVYKLRVYEFKDYKITLTCLTILSTFKLLNS